MKNAKSCPLKLCVPACKKKKKTVYESPHPAAPVVQALAKREGSAVRASVIWGLEDLGSCVRLSPVPGNLTYTWITSVAKCTLPAGRHTK